MKGIRFYQEFENRSKTRPTRNVIAVCLGDGPGFTSYGGYIQGGQVLFEAMCAVFAHANSAVCFSAVDQRHLREKCKRIPESKARVIHPRLFERLDAAA